MKEEKFMKQEIYERAAEGNKYNTFAMWIKWKQKNCN